MSFRDACCITTGFAVDNDIKRAVATSTSAQVYSGAALDGPASKVPFIQYGIKAPRRTLTVTTTAVVGAYNTTDPVIFRGMLDGAVAWASVKLISSGGGETVGTSAPLEIVESVEAPAMLLNTGNIRFGVGDAVFGPELPVRIVAGAAGVFKVRTALGIDRDLSMTAGEIEDLQIQRVLRSNATFPLTVFFS
ncbi:MAG: hypothetical protein HOW73_32955 [Polyangiaceae bacterium]|nr:hypothetical protein [Polyangiaceae bacterium]